MSASLSIRPPNAKRAFFQLLLGVCCLAASPLLVRISHVGPVSSAFFRLLLAQPILFLMLGSRLGAASLPGKDSHARWSYLAGAFLGLNLALWNVSLSMISVANATLIDNLAPVFIALFAWLLFGERPQAKLTLGMLLALLGAGVLALGEPSGGNPDAVISGHLIALAGAVCYAAYFLALKQAMACGHFESVMLHSSLGATFTLVPLMLLSGEAWWPQSLVAWGILAVMALLVHCAGQGLVGKGFAALPAASASLLLLLQPVLSAAFAWLLFGEQLTLMQLCGAAAVLAGIYWASTQPTRRPRTQHTP